MTGKRGKKSTKTRSQRADTGDVSLAWTQPKPRVHTFTRMVGVNDITKNPADSGYGISFRLSDLPSFTQFTSLFDFYKLDWVEYIFVLKSSTVTNFGPIIYFAEDHDGDTAPTRPQMLAAQTTQIVTFGTDRTTVKFRLRPNIVREVFRGVTPGYERAPPGIWLDCANADIPHYGVKYFIDNYNSGSAAGNLLSVALRYQVSFKEAI